MNEKIYELVSEKLRNAADCPAKNDIAEELTADLTDKYNELLAQGKSEEEAFSEIRESMGDLKEVVTFINEGNRRQKTEFESGAGAAFSDLENSLRRLAKELTTSLQPGLREMADDLKSAAIHARDAAKEAGGPLREMGREVGKEISGGFKTAARNINITYSRGDNRYDYEVDGTGVLSVDVHTTGGDVVFGISENENIYVVEHASAALPEDKRANIQVVDGVLRIGQGQRSSSGFVFFGYGALQSDFEIYLPRKSYENINIVTASGDVDLDDDRNFRHLYVKTTSGDIGLPHLTCGLAEVSTVSGDVSMTGEMEEINVQTISGEMEVSGTIHRILLHTTSGDCDLRLDSVPENMDLETVSGDIRVYLPDNDGFTLRYKRVSGDLRSDFPLTTSFGSRSGYATYKNGDLCEYSMATVSGDLKLMKR